MTCSASCRCNYCRDWPLRLRSGQAVQTGGACATYCTSTRPRLAVYTQDKALYMLAQLRFLWNATRGHRLAPLRSEYLRWRVETYSGKRAETLTSRDVLGFLWSSRWEFLSYLVWIGRLHREVRKSS